MFETAVNTLSTEDFDPWLTNDISSDGKARLWNAKHFVQRPIDDSPEVNRSTTMKSLTDLTAELYVEPTEQHIRKQNDMVRKHLKAFRAAEERIMELKKDAHAEGYNVSDTSEKDLLIFLDSHILTRRPFITLLDNGNLRALWKNKKGEQIGLQFRGRNQVQYVFFAYRQNANFMARASGRDSLTNIERHIEAHNLERLMAA